MATGGGNAPNHFLALKITDVGVMGNLQAFQARVGGHIPKLKPALTRMDKMHITCGLLHLKDDAEARALARELAIMRTELMAKYNPGGIFLKIAGSDSFRESEFHMNVVSGSGRTPGKRTFVNFVTDLKKMIAKKGYEVTDMNRPYQPHVTVIKITRGVSSKIGITDIPQTALQRALQGMDPSFGYQQVNAIHLLQMGPPDKPYKQVGKVTFV